MEAPPLEQYATLGIEIEGGQRPACVAELIALHLR